MDSRGRLKDGRKIGGRVPRRRVAGPRTPTSPIETSQPLPPYDLHPPSAGAPDLTIPAIAVLLLPLAGPLQSPQAPLDTLVDVGGYHLHMVVYRGTRPLTIVMESGGGTGLAAWSGVKARLAERTGATVVAYDRAGFGESDMGPADLTPQQQVRHLHEALERLRTAPDRIVVGHSYGGLLALMHAHLYPERVRGLVLVDPMNVRFVQVTGDFVQSTVPHIEHPVSAKDTAIARMVRTFDALARDGAASDAGLALPIVVITAGEPWWKKADVDRAWRESHQAIVHAAPRRRLVVADGSDHNIPEKRPEAIVQAVLSLTTQLR
jgi:pimeloyl-ACP methyl ester carboxylesterase